MAAVRDSTSAVSTARVCSSLADSRPGGGKPEFKLDKAIFLPLVFRRDYVKLGDQRGDPPNTWGRTHIGAAGSLTQALAVAESDWIPCSFRVSVAAWCYRWVLS